MKLRFAWLSLLAATLVMSRADRLEIVAHRGASYDAPENTLSAFKLGFEQGADAVELDIHLTKDGKIAVLHDYDLQRQASNSVKVVECSLADLRKLNVADFGKWRGRNLNEKIPTLDEVLGIVPAGKRVVIEIKCHEEILPALAQTLAGSSLSPKQLPIITFNYEVARAAKALLPAHEVLWLHGWSNAKPNPAVTELVQKAKTANLDGLDLNSGFPIDEKFVQEVHAAGLKLYTWTVNDPVIATAQKSAGVDGITTDRPGWLRAQLGE